MYSLKLYTKIILSSFPTPWYGSGAVVKPCPRDALDKPTLRYTTALYTEDRLRYAITSR